MSHWADGFWAHGFFAPGFWFELATIATIEAEIDGYTVRVTPPYDVTLFAVALPPQAPTPNSAQIAIGCDGDGVPALAAAQAAGIEDEEAELHLTGLDFPVHDVYVAGRDSVGSFLHVEVTARQLKLPPAGRQYQPVTL